MAAILLVYVGNFVVSEAFRPLAGVLITIGFLDKDGRRLRLFPFTAWGLYANLPADGALVTNLTLRLQGRLAPPGSDFDGFVFRYSRFSGAFLHHRILRYATASPPRDRDRDTLLSFLARAYFEARGVSAPEEVTVLLELHEIEVRGGAIHRGRADRVLPVTLRLRSAS